MGADRALITLGLQALLMGGVRDFREDAAVIALNHRALATAASLDYVLMLSTETAGTRIPRDDAQRAIHEGFARAVDDALMLLRAIVAIEDRVAQAFVAAGLRTLRAAIDAEQLGDDDRTFAMIALASDVRA